MNYKSTRLLVEAIKKEMKSVRKSLMRRADAESSEGLDLMNDLNSLVDQLADRANRVAVEDLIKEMTPADYVATMKPLVMRYHQSLMASNLLASCLCEDLNAGGILLVVVSDKSSVRTVYRDDRPDAAAALSLMVDAIDDCTKKAISMADPDASPGSGGEEVR